MILSCSRMRRGTGWGHSIRTWNREKPSFWRVCSFSRRDVSRDCQGAGPDRVAHDQAMKDASGKGISHPQKADRQTVASCKDPTTSSVHKLLPNSWGFWAGKVFGILGPPKICVSSANAGTDWGWEKARLILSFYRQETGAHTSRGCNSRA